MTHEEKARLSGCEGKAAYESYGAALKESTRWKAKRVVPYRCRTCHQWHVAMPLRPKRPMKNV